MDGGGGGRFSKRLHSQIETDGGERNVRQKRRGGLGFERGASGFDRAAPGFDRMLVEPGAPKIPLREDVVFRILCPGSKIGSVIGKGGSIIKSLRGETGAKIKVADGLHGSEERVILISASIKEKRDGKQRRHDKDFKEDNLNEGELPPSQEALFKVFERIIEGDGLEEDEDTSRNVTARLLVPNNQIGCLLGKGGKIIEQMRVESGAQIRVLPKEQLPKCAFDTDELVQISGDTSIVKKALMKISTRIYENPPKDNRLQGGHINPALLPGALLHHAMQSVPVFPQGNGPIGPGQIGGPPLLGLAPQIGGLNVANSGWPYSNPGLQMPHGFPGGHPKDDSPEAELVVRLLCPNEKIGSVIGKGGSIIRHIREETMARIKIADGVPNAEERVIIVSANEIMYEQISPCLEAVLQLHHRIADVSLENGSTTTRLLVPSANIGCILGKKGTIIAEMRRATRAAIRVMSKESLPKCALEDDELVQIVGDFNMVRDAVIEIVTRLRGHLFKEHLKNNPQTNMSIPSLFESRHEPSPGLYSQGLRPPIASSPRAWGLQAHHSGGIPYGGGSTPSAAAFGNNRSGGGLVASVAGTTIEISIPSAVIGSIIGKGGSNISQIRNISGAKVKLHDGKPGADKRIIEISGTPDQTQAAQSLLEAFMFTQGAGAPRY